MSADQATPPSPLTVEATEYSELTPEEVAALAVEVVRQRMATLAGLGPSERQPLDVPVCLPSTLILRLVGSAASRGPIPMRLPCPGTVPDGAGGLRVCGQLHVDKGVFATKPHHTHSCQVCGHTWRPAVPATVGVRFLPGFKDEEP